MNETAVQAAIQTTLKAMSEFADADVVINDWSILDQSSLAAPYVIITNAADINEARDTTDAQTAYTVPVTLVERFTNWADTLNGLRNRREAIFNAFTGAARSANGLEGTNFTRVRTASPILEYYDRGLSSEQLAVALPVFLQQDIAIDVEEF